MVDQEAAHADDRVHGGTNLVAHVRQKFALGPVRRLGRDFGATQFLLVAPAPGDVPQDENPGLHVVPAVGDGQQSDFAGQLADRHVGLVHFTLAKEADDLRPRGEYGCGALSERTFRGHSQRRAGRAVEIDHPVYGVEDDQLFLQIFDQHGPGHRG